MSCDQYAGCGGGGVEPGGRRHTRTSLVHSDAFMRQFSHLIADRSAGHLAGAPVEPPEEFDGRAVWAAFTPPVRDQGSCGACWAFATADCLSMRLAIATYGRHKPRLSPAQMVFCNLGSDAEAQLALERAQQGIPYDYTPANLRASERVLQKEHVAEVGCQGETLIGAWQYAYRFGLTEEGCVPYTGGYVLGSDLRVFDGGSDLPACSDILGSSYDVCPTTGKPAQRHRCNAYYYVPGTPQHYQNPDQMDDDGQNLDTVGTFAGVMEESTLADIYSNKDATGLGPDSESGTERNIRREIYHWGPVTSGFTVHDDFYAWDGKGVYAWDHTSAESGGHAIVIVGWGRDGETGMDYWMVRNSWGASWGDGGYFRVARGSNECGIEENVVVGFPFLHGFRLYCERPLLSADDDLRLRSIWSILPSGHKLTTAERVLDGRLPAHFVDLDRLQYDSDWWPNLATFVAGKPWQTEYLMQRNRAVALMRPRNQRERTALFHVGVGLAVGAVLAAGVGYLFFFRNKDTRKPL